MQSQQTVTATMGGTRKWGRSNNRWGEKGWRRFKYNGNKKSDKQLSETVGHGWRLY